LYVALDGPGNNGTDAGSREDCVNKGSDGDGRDGASDSMLLYLLCSVLFWIHSVLIPTSRLYVAVGGAGNDGTDAGSREDCVNKGSDGDGRGGGSDGMLIVVFGFGIILDSFCSHTPTTS
jgi:hypothetical protein